ncbi:hypothetical protein [Lactococcus petauri]|uniref:hypothetical protein n=1 Tax=Lactococcus petauri TaxID=1940789 RepID=UPI00254AE953|nr:hypothetical protein [Lactococcus petauri]
MKQDLYELLDKIIQEEGKRYTSMSVIENVDGGKIEKRYKSPSYFKYIKQMYKKEWDGPLNPNNVYIPFVLISIEAILRQIISIEKESVAYPRGILSRLLSKESPLNVDPEWVYYIRHEDFERPIAHSIPGITEHQLNQFINDLVKEEKYDRNKIKVTKRDANKFRSDLFDILNDINKKYYVKRGEQGAYRNVIMHANTLLFLEDNDTFSTILQDYYHLISSVWGDPIMHYEKGKKKTAWMF